MCRPSFVPPKPIRRLRDLTRYRRTLVRDRTREKQRLEKLLEDAQIKLSTVASNILGVSGRAMLEAMIAGERDPKILAQMARARMRGKISQLEEALHGHFDDHHALICQMMLERIDDLTARIDELTDTIQDTVTPYAAQITRLDEVTGIGTTAAQDLIAELGVDMNVFPTAAHLVSWAKFAPQAPPVRRQEQTGHHRQGQPLAGRHPRRNRRHRQPHQHLPRRALPAPGQTPRQTTRHRRGRQLGTDDHLAPAVQPRGPLPRPRPRLPPVPRQPATPATQPGPPTRAPHRTDRHPHPDARTDRRVTLGAHPPDSTHMVDPIEATPRCCRLPLKHRFSSLAHVGVGSGWEGVRSRSAFRAPLGPRAGLQAHRFSGKING